MNNNKLDRCPGNNIKHKAYKTKITFTLVDAILKNNKNGKNISKYDAVNPIRQNGNNTKIQIINAFLKQNWTT